MKSVVRLTELKRREADLTGAEARVVWLREKVCSAEVILNSYKAELMYLTTHPIPVGREVGRGARIVWLRKKICSTEAILNYDKVELMYLTQETIPVGRGVGSGIIAKLNNEIQRLRGLL